MIYQYPNVISFIRQSSDRQMSAFINLQSSYGTENLVLFTSIVYVYETLCSNDWRWDTLISHFFFLNIFFFPFKFFDPGPCGFVLFATLFFCFCRMKFCYLSHFHCFSIQQSTDKRTDVWSRPSVIYIQTFSRKKNWFFQFFLTFDYLYCMQFFCADPKIFSKKF